MKESPQSTLNLKKVPDKATCLSASVYTLFRDTFLLIKNNKNINSIKIFENNFPYTAYADDGTFFLKDNQSRNYRIQ